MSDMKTSQVVSFRNPKHEAQFNRDGFIVLEETINQESLEELRTFYLESQQFYMGDNYESTFEPSLLKAHRNDVFCIFNLHTQDIASKLFIDYELYYGGLGVKNKQTPNSYLELHQDNTMVPYSSTRTGITLWFTLDECANENGCLQIYPGSHLINRNPRSTAQDFAYKENYDEIVGSRLIDAPVNKGQIILMDQALIHRSLANVSSSNRIAYMGMYKPIETELVYYLDNAFDSSLLDEYRVPKDFYIQQNLGQPPSSGSHIRTVNKVTNAFPCQF